MYMYRVVIFRIIISLIRYLFLNLFKFRTFNISGYEATNIDTLDDLNYLKMKLKNA